MKKYLFFAIIFVVTGCVPQRENMKINMSTFQKPITILVAQIGEYPKPVYVKEGDQGLLDALINHTVSDDVHEALDQCIITDVIDTAYYKEFESTFKKKKVKFMLHKTPFDKKNFIKTEDELIHLAPYDLSVLKNKFNADYVLILEPIRYYLERSYWGVIPTSAPRGVSDYRMYFVNLKTNELEGYYKTFLKVDAKGWVNHEPDDLIKHLKEVVKNHLLEGHDYFTKF